MTVRCNTFRFNITEVKSLLNAYLNDSLAKRKDGYIQGCKAICYDKVSHGLTLTTFICQHEMHEVMQHLRQIKVSRASQWLEGYHYYSLLVWVNFEDPTHEDNAMMPVVRQTDVERSIRKLMALYYKKVGDRFDGKSN